MKTYVVAVDIGRVLVSKLISVDVTGIGWVSMETEVELKRGNLTVEL